MTSSIEKKHLYFRQLIFVFFIPLGFLRTHAMSGTFLNNSSTINFEFCFIPIEIVTIICIIFGIILATIFVLTIIFDKTCHTVPMMLIGNSCLIGFIFGILILSMRLYTLNNDLKQIQYQDLFCSFRGYFGYATCSIQNCSYLLQAIYRYITVVYPNRVFCHSARFQLILICLTWAFGFLYPIAFLFTGQIVYNVDNQICQLPLRLSFSIIYMANFAYITPVSLTIFVYFKLVRFVKEMSKRVTPVNALSRAQRELKMVRRTAILVSILFILCFPYAVFIFLSFFTRIPIYHFRISYIFLDVAYTLVILIVFQFTDQLKASLLKKMNVRPITVVQTIT
jgi:hypothetical protein